MKICVIDSIMGSGKTTWAREYMLGHPENRWWFISPYKEQIRNMKRSCSILDFQRPMGDEKEELEAEDLIINEDGEVQEQNKKKFSNKSKELLSLI